MAKYLRCHTSGNFVTAGEKYKVISENALGFSIRDDNGSPHSFTYEKYANWFTLEDGTEHVAGITLLPDESLGGTLREYREVKRKAAVGELVKVIDDSCAQYTAGKAYVAHEETLGFGDIRIDSYYGGTVHLRGDEYVVLEQTDIIVIDGERLRMVDHKAAVGERVIVTKSRTFNMKPGDCGVCTQTDEFTDASIDAKLDNGEPVFVDCAREGYAVLEPVESAEPAPPTLLSDQPAESQAAANIATLTLKVTALEAQVEALYAWHKRAAVDLRVAREDIVFIEEGVSGDIKALERRILALETETAPAYVEVVSGTVSDALPSFAKSVAQGVVDAINDPEGTARRLAGERKSPQQIRDEIVERAKDDVSDLRKFKGTRLRDTMFSFWPHSELPTQYFPIHTVEYVVNRKKRTVVVLIRSRAWGVVARGIAKCAPGETFNSTLGKAIALHRALGLEVPAEYMSAPQPTEVRVGDVIANKYGTRLGAVKSLVDGAFGSAGLTYDKPNPRRADGYTWTHLDSAVVTDDSREDITSSPRKEAA